MTYFIILLLINWFLGAISYYIKNKELTLMIIISSFMCGFMIFAMYFLLEPMVKMFEFLDDIKILKKKEKINPLKRGVIDYKRINV